MLLTDITAFDVGQANWQLEKVGTYKAPENGSNSGELENQIHRFRMVAY